MKKLKYLVILLALTLIIPFTVYAEDEETYNEEEVVEEASEETPEETTENNEQEESKEVKIYFFRGEGCPHCEEAEEWFKSIEEEYGSLFEVVDYETWYNEDNAKLMQDVAEVRGETAEGVPYIIIGDKSWNGFAESYEEDIINQIKTLFEQNVSERYDVMKYLDIIGNGKKTDEEKESNDALALILIILITGGVGFGIYQARKKTN